MELCVCVRAFIIPFMCKNFACTVRTVVFLFSFWIGSIAILSYTNCPAFDLLMKSLLRLANKTNHWIYAYINRTKVEKKELMMYGDGFLLLYIVDSVCLFTSNISKCFMTMPSSPVSEKEIKERKNNIPSKRYKNSKWIIEHNLNLCFVDIKLHVS